MEPETVDLLSESGDAIEAHEDWNQVEFPEACTFDVASLPSFVPGRDDNGYSRRLLRESRWVFLSKP